MVIAAITSCTNTSNPSVLVAAGLLAKKATEKGLKSKPWVKTSLAPGSKVVTEYLAKAGLTPYLEKIGFQTVGYGCTTCIGNSGPLPETVSKAIEQGALVAAAVLSGNRNFEGRVHAEVRANYLASPPLVVAYALAGTVDIDPYNEPLGTGTDGKPVFLRDIWPTRAEVQAAIDACIDRAMFERVYGHIFDGDEDWKKLRVPTGDLYAWDAKSTYVKHPPYFEGMGREPSAIARHQGRARARGARRQHHHRPHLSRRQHQEEQPGRAVPHRAAASTSRTSTRTGRGAATTRRWCAAPSPTSACATSSLRERRAA